VELGTPLDRRRLRALNVEPVLSQAPIVIESHAFTTGVVPRTSIEHVLPNTWAKLDFLPIVKRIKAAGR
jgi:7,8-dihydropterin-6-yl-methyl-4-(beta-D-ribofuranosyl)aminobenzene 5'-phosphate synthase